MSVNPDVEKLMDAWWEFPNRLLESWQGAVKEGLSPPWDRVYGRALDAAESMTHTGLRTQADWLRLCIDGMRSGTEDPTIRDRWAEQAQALMDGWTEVCRQVASSGFQMLKELGPFPWSSIAAGGAQAVMQGAPGIQLMQDMLRNTMRLQRVWALLFLPQATTEGGALGPEAAVREKPERKGTARRVIETEQAA